MFSIDFVQQNHVLQEPILICSPEHTHLNMYKKKLRLTSEGASRASYRVYVAIMESARLSRGVHGDLPDKTPHRARKNHVDPVIRC